MRPLSGCLDEEEYTIVPRHVKQAYRYSHRDIVNYSSRSRYRRKQEAAAPLPLARVLTTEPQPDFFFLKNIFA